MKLAFYKSSKGTKIDKIIDIGTGMYGYSHIELVFSDGMSLSSSPREGEVRFKEISYDPNTWEYVDIDITEEQERLLRYKSSDLVGKKYDYFGILFWYIIPIKKQKNDKWWCSEICAYLLGWDEFRVTPNKMARHYGLERQPFVIKASYSKDI